MTKDMTTDEMRRQTFNRAVKLLTIKPRSVAELRSQIAQGKVDFTGGTMFHRQYGYAQAEGRWRLPSISTHRGASLDAISSWYTLSLQLQ